MSFLGRGGNVPAGGVNPEKIDMAITECVLFILTHFSYLTRYRLDTVTDFFNRMVLSVILEHAELTFAQ